MKCAVIISKPGLKGLFTPITLQLLIDATEADVTYSFEIRYEVHVTVQLSFHI